MCVHGKNIEMVEINFLCVHKKLRDKRLAPVLIKEITRRVNLQNIWQAVYTAGKLLPGAISSARYWHRSLNPKKLIDIGFSHLQPRMTMTRTVKLYSLPKVPALQGIRPLEKKDIPSAHILLNKYLAQYEVHPVLSPEEFEHWFFPINNIIDSFVISNKDGEVTDLVSFYTLSSTVIGNATHHTLKAAYSYYNIATTVKLQDLVHDALIFAKNKNFDVFNCLDLMQNESFLTELKFGRGDGNLQYYFYNYRIPPLEPKKVGLVLL